MRRQATDKGKAGPEVARRLEKLFARWANEEDDLDHADEPSWSEVKKTLNEGRPADGKPFPGG